MSSEYFKNIKPSGRLRRRSYCHLMLCRIMFPHLSMRRTTDSEDSPRYSCSQISCQRYHPNPAFRLHVNVMSLASHVLIHNKEPMSFIRTDNSAVSAASLSHCRKGKAALPSTSSTAVHPRHPRRARGHPRLISLTDHGDTQLFEEIRNMCVFQRPRLAG